MTAAVGHRTVAVPPVIPATESCHHESVHEATVLVCHCRVISDRAVRAAASAGATSVHEVAAVCGAGGECGGCHPTIEALLAEAAIAVAAPERMAERQRQARVGGRPVLAPAH